MNERLKILDLLKEGKITVEQADLLLEAVAEKESVSTQRYPQWEKTAAELKSLGSQVSSLVSQTLGEVKRGLETQLDIWPFHDTISVTVERELPAAETLALETINGKIRVETWDEPFTRVYIRGEVRAEEGDDPAQLLEEAITQTGTERHVQIRVAHKGGRRGVAGAAIDVYLPKSFDLLTLNTKNGNIQLERTTCREISADTLNGSVTGVQVAAERLRCCTANGKIDLNDSVHATTRSVYLTSKNGMVSLNGIDADCNCAGKVRTSLGIVDIDGDDLEIAYEDSRRKNAATFCSRNNGHNAVTDIYCETKNGRVFVRA